MAAATTSPPTAEGQEDVLGTRRVCRGVKVRDRPAWHKDGLAGKFWGRRVLTSKSWEMNMLVALGTPKFFSKATRHNDF